MTPLEWIGAFFAVWVFVKFIVLSIKPEEFIKNASKAISKRNNKWVMSLTLVVFFALAYYLLQEITIVQLFVAMLAGMLLMAHTWAHYPKVMNMYVREFKGKNPNAKVMLDWLIWLVIAGWVLKELFF